MVMKNPCHYPDLCATGAFSSSRSDGVNLAVGFNPRVGAIIDPPSRQRRLNPDGGSPPHTTFVVINPLLALVGSIVATRRGKYLNRNCASGVQSGVAKSDRSRREVAKVEAIRTKRVKSGKNSFLFLFALSPILFPFCSPLIPIRQDIYKGESYEKACCNLQRVARGGASDHPGNFHQRAAGRRSAGTASRRRSRTGYRATGFGRSHGV